MGQDTIIASISTATTKNNINKKYTVAAYKKYPNNSVKSDSSQSIQARKGYIEKLCKFILNIWKEIKSNKYKTRWLDFKPMIVQEKKVKINAKKRIKRIINMQCKCKRQFAILVLRKYFVAEKNSRSFVVWRFGVIDSSVI